MLLKPFIILMLGATAHLRKLFLISHRWPVSFLARLMMIVCGVSGASLASAPKPWQLGFQDAASPIMEQIQAFHDTLLIILTAIAVFVIGLIFFVVYKFRAGRNHLLSKTSHNTALEIIWTGIPVLILAYLAFPSIKLIYSMEEAPEADLTIKVVGHQWYWSYEYPDENIKFDSYMIEDQDLKPGDIRLLSVDNPLVVPVGAVVRIQATSADVLHSWAVPSLGVKKDCVTGRLNQTWFKVNKEGVYYGQCSELCGMKHGFMPIAVKAVSREAFEAWSAEAKNKFTASAKFIRTLKNRVGVDLIINS